MPVLKVVPQHSGWLLFFWIAPGKRYFLQYWVSKVTDCNKSFPLLHIHATTLPKLELRTQGHSSQRSTASLPRSNTLFWPHRQYTPQLLFLYFSSWTLFYFFLPTELAWVPQMCSSRSNKYQTILFQNSPWSSYYISIDSHMPNICERRSVMPTHYSLLTSPPRLFPGPTS